MELKYVKGVENVVADALSRRPDLALLDGALSSLIASTTATELDDQEVYSEPQLEQLLLMAECDVLGLDAEFSQLNGDDEPLDELGDIVQSIRTGYADDKLVERARKETSARAARGDRAPETEPTSSGQRSAQAQRTKALYRSAKYLIVDTDML
jgi:hypothetical protein